ncbi:hypothetical protein D9M71_812150 [compost metagenome]
MVGVALEETASHHHVIALVLGPLIRVIGTLRPGQHVQKGEHVRAARLGSSESSHGVLQK